MSFIEHITKSSLYPQNIPIPQILTIFIPSSCPELGFFSLMAVVVCYACAANIQTFITEKSSDLFKLQISDVRICDSWKLDD